MACIFSSESPSGISTLKIKIVMATPKVASVNEFILLISNKVGFMLELLQNVNHKIPTKWPQFWWSESLSILDMMSILFIELIVEIKYYNAWMSKFATTYQNLFDMGIGYNKYSNKHEKICLCIDDLTWVCF